MPAVCQCSARRLSNSFTATLRWNFLSRSSVTMSLKPTVTSQPPCDLAHISIGCHTAPSRSSPSVRLAPRTPQCPVLPPRLRGRPQPLGLLTRQSLGSVRAPSRPSLTPLLISPSLTRRTQKSLDFHEPQIATLDCLRPPPSRCPPDASNLTPDPQAAPLALLLLTADRVLAPRRQGQP